MRKSGCDSMDRRARRFWKRKVRGDLEEIEECAEIWGRGVRGDLEMSSGGSWLRWRQVGCGARGGCCGETLLARELMERERKRKRGRREVCQPTDG